MAGPFSFFTVLFLPVLFLPVLFFPVFFTGLLLMSRKRFRYPERLRRGATEGERQHREKG